jgi:hypothetical protein
MDVSNKKAGFTGEKRVRGAAKRVVSMRPNLEQGKGALALRPLMSHLSENRGGA